MRCECRCPKCGKKLAEMGRLLAGSSLFKRCPNCRHWSRWRIALEPEGLRIMRKSRCPHCKKTIGENYGYPVWIKCPRCKEIAVF